MSQDYSSPSILSFEIAARESGMIWLTSKRIFPGIGIWLTLERFLIECQRRVPVRSFTRKRTGIIDVDQPPREVTSTFNPEAQSFKPLDYLMTSKLQITSPDISSCQRQLTMPGMSTGIPVFPSNMTPSFKTPVTAPLASFVPKQTTLRWRLECLLRQSLDPRNSKAVAKGITKNVSNWVWQLHLAKGSDSTTDGISDESSFVILSSSLWK